jgi:hypothetical protein
VCKARIPIDGDCSDAGAICVEDAECVEGVCNELGEAGDACPCVRGLWCDDTDHCRAPAPLGADCTQETWQNSFFYRCEAPLVCEPNELGANGPADFTCQPRRGKGELCVPLHGTCEAELWCDAASNLCREQGAEGGDCDARLPTDSCQPGLFCECTSNCTADLSRPGKCRALGGTGDECTVAAGCVSGQCVANECAPACP